MSIIMTLGILHFVPNETNQSWLYFWLRIREKWEGRIDFHLLPLFRVLVLSQRYFPVVQQDSFLYIAYFLMNNQWKKIWTVILLYVVPNHIKEDIFGQNNSTTRSTINTEMRRWYGHCATSLLRLPHCHLWVFLHWHSHKRPFVHFSPLSLFARFN